MPDEMTLEEVMAEQEAVAALAAKLKPDMPEKKRQALVKKITSRAAKLEKLAAEFQAQQLARPEVAAAIAEPIPHPKLLVELTEEQRDRIQERLGVRIEAVYLSDPHARLSHAMPSTPPDFVEAMAYRYGRVAQQLKAAVAAMDANSPPEALEVVRAIKRDPELIRVIQENLILAEGELDL